jgi:transposase
VPALPSCIFEPLLAQFAALLPTREAIHPLGCHRRRIPDRIIFDKLIQVLVFGCGYRRIDDHTCSATTVRRRRDEWIALGLADRLRLIALAAYDRMIGLELSDIAIDGCITKAPCGGQAAGRSPGTVASRASSDPSPPRPTASRSARCQHPPTATMRRCSARPWTP